MPRKQAVALELRDNERMLLYRWIKNPWGNKVVRADIVLRAARGQTNYRISKDLGISRNTVKLWRYRFAQERIKGLESKPIPGRPRRQRAFPADAQSPRGDHA